MRRKEIKWKDLPRSFADAIIIARARSLDYLWIDSLCIIQDSLEDWAEQSAQMGEIYRNCDICIGAADASDATGCCFRNRQGLENRPVKLWETPAKLLLPDFGNCGPVYVCLVNSDNTVIHLSEGPGYYRSNSSPQGTSVLGKVVYRGLA